MRMIDADAEFLVTVNYGGGLSECYRTTVAEYLGEYIDKIPTIDAVPVVRCEKCACHSDLLLKGWEDTVWCNLFHLYRCNDSFCNCGRVE